MQLNLKLWVMLGAPVLLALVTLSIAQLVDPETGLPLPNELNDGELEGGQYLTPWDYLSQNLWSLMYPFCKGLLQSPIDILTSLVVYRPLYKVEFIEYDQQVEFIIRNTNHSISLLPVPMFNIPAIKLSWLPGENIYDLQEIHVHWGNNITAGSEHRLDGFQAAAELHFVHYKRGVNKADLGITPNSIVVLAVMVEPGRRDYNRLEVIARNLAKIDGTNIEFLVPTPLLLMDLLPLNYQAFFTYEGSLTTPPCYEVVTWIVLRQPVYIFRDLLMSFINLRAFGLDYMPLLPLRANYRDLQPILDRPVYSSFNTGLIDLPNVPELGDTPAGRALMRLRAARDRLAALG